MVAVKNFERAKEGFHVRRLGAGGAGDMEGSYAVKICLADKISSVQPTSLTVIASCGANGNTYAVGPTDGTRNTLSGNATQVVWNPWQWEQSAGATPFAEATYVLKVWDERGPQATVRGGYFSPYAGTQFSLYRPAQATPLSGESFGPLQSLYRGHYEGGAR